MGCGCHVPVCRRLQPSKPSTSSYLNWNCTQKEYDIATKSALECYNERAFNTTFEYPDYDPLLPPYADQRPVLERFGDCSTCSVRDEVPEDSLLRGLGVSGAVFFSIGVLLTFLPLLICLLDMRYRRLVYEGRHRAPKIRYGNETDRTKVLLSVRRDGMTLKHACFQSRHDFEIVMAAIKQNGRALQFAGRELKERRDVQIEALQQTYFALEYCTEDGQ
jgi:hypothetical protein